MTTRHISSPLSGVFSSAVQQYGSDVVEFGSNFLGGGAFSPDGRQLAAFVSAYRPHDWPNAQLVLVNPNTGSVQLIANTVIQIGEPAGWATWSPTGSDLFGGSYREGPVIQAFALKTGQTQATPLTFDKNAADDVTGSAVSVQVSGR
jgi:Tol biopolymer transport system component